MSNAASYRDPRPVSPPPRRADIPALTTLRFFAALVVVIFHVGFEQSSGWLPQVVQGWFASGYEAVTFFFVLSGFVLGYVYSEQTSGQAVRLDYFRFMKARFARLAPAYYLGLLIALPASVNAYFIAKVLSTEEFTYSLVLVPLFLQAWIPPASLALNPPAWSLSVEFFFYALFPLLIRFASRLPVWKFSLLACGLAALTAGLQQYALMELAVGVPAKDSGARFAYYFPPLHLGAFVTGLALARMFLFGPRPSSPSCDLLFCVSVVILAGLFGFRDQLPDWTRWYAILIPIFGALVYFAASSNLANRALGGRRLVLLGEASYPLYILHVPIIFWTGQLLERLPSNVALYWQRLFLTPALAVIVAVLVTLLYERRAHGFLKRRLAG